MTAEAAQIIQPEPRCLSSSFWLLAGWQYQYLCASWHTAPLIMNPGAPRAMLQSDQCSSVYLDTLFTTYNGIFFTCTRVWKTYLFDHNQCRDLTQDAHGYNIIDESTFVLQSIILRTPVQVRILPFYVEQGIQGIQVHLGCSLVGAL